MGKEEDLARILVKSLDLNQISQALVAEVAYPDILTKADSRAKMDRQPTGLPASKMNTKQLKMLMDLIHEYTSNLSADLAMSRAKAVQKTPLDQLFFALDLVITTEFRVHRS